MVYDHGAKFRYQTPFSSPNFVTRRFAIQSTNQHRKVLCCVPCAVIHVLCFLSLHRAAIEMRCRKHALQHCRPLPRPAKHEGHSQHHPRRQRHHILSARNINGRRQPMYRLYPYEGWNCLAYIWYVQFTPPMCHASAGSSDVRPM
jgi:hypothetical protein